MGLTKMGVKINEAKTKCVVMGKQKERQEEGIILKLENVNNTAGEVGEVGSTKRSIDARLVNGECNAGASEPF